MLGESGHTQSGRHRYQRPAPGHEEVPPVTTPDTTPAPVETGGTPPPPARATGTTSRRERVEKGVYRRTTSEGERFDVIYRDREGKQRLTTTTAEGAFLVTLPQARKRREELRVSARRGEVTVRTRVTFAEYAEAWLHDTEARKRPSTVVRDRGDVERHLVPHLGRLYLADLDADAVAGLVAVLQSEGKVVRKGGKVVGRTGLAAHSVTNVLGVLSRIMQRAVRAKLVAANPVAMLEASERPAPDALPFPVLDAADLAAFMAAVRDDGRRRRSLAPYVARDTALVWVTMTTGLRQSEVLGLRWRDIDMSEGVLQVRQAHGRYDDQLKTRAARRTVALEPEALRMLASLSLATRHGEPDDYVFATADGKPLNGRNVLRIVERARAASGLDAKCDAQGARRLTFHGLRHLYASLRIANGDALVDVSRALGHADVTTTDRIYSHAIAERTRLEREAASVASTFAGVLS
jgi:integrase